MSSPVVQIQARLSSTRLPGKVLYEIGSRRVVDWVVERAKGASYADETVVAIGGRSENQA
ncbi:MAG: cytidylyltransferase domain-containing protein, partial [Halobacteriaceae archaeon]